MATSFTFYYCRSLLVSPLGLIASLLDQGVIGIGYSQYSRCMGNIFPLEARWISSPISSFMVAGGQLGGNFEYRNTFELAVYLT